MAKVQAIWGIDIGQCSLKALRCVSGENGEVIADAFDFVEYPKILSQPDVEPEELVKEALEQFLSRNDVKGDKVAISVTGQAGLSRFFKPPPVDPKMLPDIVKYEAKQQIPFPLEDVIWDYQRIGGTEVEGLIVDSEVGLFAMKREAVYRALQPFSEAGIEVDYIQLSPLAAFNFVVKDILADVDENEEIDPENPPESLVLLALGTETTDLVVTNGINVWMRNIPIGGNHFTKQLSRELKLTFTKAEHLKRNTRQAEDPKTLFQAMRPVFNDLVTEIQRSISYFRGINRNAKIGRMCMVGNAAKLPGLRQYLIKNLETEIVKFEKFPTLEGDVVVGQKAFNENVLTFNVAYGLCLQGLGQARLKTNLLPQEFLTERLIRAKKPWALASLGAVMVGLTCSLLFSANGWWKVNEQRVVDGKSWKDSFGAVKQVSDISKSFITQDDELTTQHGQFNALNRELTQSKDPLMAASEIFSAVLQAFPEGPNSKKGEPFDPLNMDFSDRETIIIEDWQWIAVEKMEDWYKLYSGNPKSGVPNEFERTALGVEPFPDPNEPSPDEGSDPDKDKNGDQNNPNPKGPKNKNKNTPAKDNNPNQKDTGPKGPGRILVLNCYHDHNDLAKYPDANDRERGYVKKTLIRNLLHGKVNFQGEETTYEALGVSYPVFIGEISEEVEIRNPHYERFLEKGEIPDKNIAEWTADEKRKYSQSWTVRRFGFRLELAWTPTPYKAREKARREAAKKKKEEEDRAKKQAGNQNDQPGNNQNNPANKNKNQKNPANQKGGKGGAKKQPANGGNPKGGQGNKGGAAQPKQNGAKQNGTKQNGAKQNAGNAGKQPAGKQPAGQGGVDPKGGEPKGAGGKAPAQPSK